MRNGILLEEGSPQYILTKYGEDSLETSFLKLCYAQQNNEVATYWFSILISVSYLIIFKYLLEIQFSLIKKNYYLCLLLQKM